MAEETYVEQDNLKPEGEEKTVEEQLEKAEELANNYKIRAEKAEAKNKKPTEAPKEPDTPKQEAQTDQNLTNKDLLALMGEKITDESDVEYLQKYAKGLGMTIAEALKDNIIKAKLEERQDERKTEQATNSGGGSSSNAKVTGASILKRAEKGDLPESAEDMDKLVKARFDKK